MTSYRLSSNVLKTATPPIPTAAKWALSYAPTPSHPLINLGQGAPGTAPPTVFLDRLAVAVANPDYTRYGAAAGELGLRIAFAKNMNQAYQGAKVTENEIAITSGCNLAFYATMVSIADSGDEVILPTPYYFNQEMTLVQLGIVPVFLPCDSAFLPSAAECKKLITSRTKAIVLVTPNNPTGAIYSPTLIQDFATLAREMKLPLVLDETYRELMPIETEVAHTLFSGGDGLDWRDVLIHLFSFSKSYSVPGHRVGAIVASSHLLTELYKTLDCIQVNPPRPVQVALEWAIEGTKEWRHARRVELNERGEVFRALMKNEAPNWKVESCGGYFAYVKHPFHGVGSQRVCIELAKQVGIVVLPGSFFAPASLPIEEDRFMRFSIANVSNEMLEEVPERLRRMEEWMK